MRYRLVSRDISDLTEQGTDVFGRVLRETDSGETLGKRVFLRHYLTWHLG